MTVEELFALNPDWTIKNLATALGYKNSNTVGDRKRRGAEVPESWYPKLAELGLNVGSAHMLNDNGRIDPASEYREQDSAPQAPPDAPRAATAPVVINYESVAGYIEGAYKMAAQVAIAQTDELLAQVIYDHAEAAGVAWAHWIESEPKVAMLLQRMMIGTPLGEVIGVHVGIVFSYTLARGAAREIAAAAGTADASSDGSSPATPAD